MKTFQAIALLGCLALPLLFAVEPLSATHPLFQAIRAGDATQVDVLMKNAAVVTARDEYGNTPLMATAWMADVAMMERWLKAGVDVNASNRAGATALLYAATFEEKAKLLVAAGANVRARSKLGNTPLILAARKAGNRLTVKLLIERGADVNVANVYGSTALMAALQLWFGRDAEYAATCQRAIEAAGKTPENLDIAARAAKTRCLRAADDAAMGERVLTLARKAVRVPAVSEKLLPWRQQTLGMAEFRAGHDEAAQAAFLQAEELAEQDNWNPVSRPFVLGPCRLFRAMILFKKGAKDEAQKLFHEAAAQMPALPEADAKVLPPGTDQNHILYWLAYQEAKSLLADSTENR